jgi:hypothetical protein
MAWIQTAFEYIFTAILLVVFGIWWTIQLIYFVSLFLIQSPFRIIWFISPLFIHGVVEVFGFLFGVLINAIVHLFIWTYDGVHLAYWIADMVLTKIGILTITFFSTVISTTINSIVSGYNFGVYLNHVILNTWVIVTLTRISVESWNMASNVWISTFGYACMIVSSSYLKSVEVWNYAGLLASTTFNNAWVHYAIIRDSAQLALNNAIANLHSVIG